MKVYTSSDFPGFWPVGSAAVVVARSKRGAATLLRKALIRKGLIKENAEDDDFTLEELDLSEPHSTILCDGNY